MSHPNRHDVRMRGFASRTSVAAALEWVDAASSPLPSETVPLERLCGRVLAADVAASIDVPPFDRAAMDGYAVQAASTNGASDYDPVLLQVVGTSLPGKPFAGQIEANSAARIMTGAPLPCGADAVVPAEFAREDDGTVALTAAVPSGKHVGQIAEDIARGTVVLTRGRRLRPQDVGVLASLGIASASVVRRPRVRILTTGNELVPAGNPLPPDHIYDANLPMLRALVERDGGSVESARCLPDDRNQLRAALTAPGADIILLCGGSSVGEEDHAPLLLAELGELAIHGIAMRPSSPTGIGRIGNVLVFLLPGNPVSCLCAYDFFAGRAIRRRQNRSFDWPYRRQEFVLSKKISSAIGRVDYCRVRIDPARPGHVLPVAVSGASILSSTTTADGFVLIPEPSEGYPPNTRVLVYLYDAEECTPTSVSFPATSEDTD